MVTPWGMLFTGRGPLRGKVLSLSTVDKLGREVCLGLAARDAELRSGTVWVGSLVHMELSVMDYGAMGSGGEPAYPTRQH